MSAHTKKRKPRKHQGFWKIIIFATFAAFLTVVFVCLMFALSYRPEIGDDAPPFISDTATETPPATDAPPDVPPEGETTGVPNDAPGKVVYTRRDSDTFNFLVIGRDRVGLNTDVILLVNFNTADGRIAIMQIPRDTYVEVNGVSHKLNSVYALYYNASRKAGSSDPESDGMNDLASLIERNMAVKLDYWLLCNLEGFRNIVDLIGGVEIDVPFNMDYEDPFQNLYIHLRAGTQVLDGDGAEEFMRYRDGYVEGDIGRVSAQKIMFSALLRQLKSSVTLTKLPSLAEQMIKNVKTPLSGADFVFFAKKALNVETSELMMITLPGEAARADGDSGAWYYVLRRADTLALINAHFNLYDSDITDELFDPKLVFTDERRAFLNGIYRTALSEDIAGAGVTGEQINSDGIKIPLIRN